jgi:sulfate transport system ATP-binding protein
VFVTHDQEEALEVADEIVVINEGRVEQIGTPDELYDAPANDFVMSFLGPVTALRGQLIRPHDLEVHAGPVDGASPATVERVTRVGFEVRLDMAVAADGAAAGPEHVVATMTRTQFHPEVLGVGRTVWVRPVVGAPTVAATERVPALAVPS